MHIAIDAHSVGAQLAGNETYAVNLIKALAEIDQSNRYTLYVTRQSAVDQFTSRWPNFQVKRTLPHTPLVRIPLTLSVELRKNRVDVLHVQYTAPPRTPCALVATIHDLSFEHLPETFKRRSRAQLRLTVRRTAKKAAQILTLSEFSRRDIIETYALDPERVFVTPPAAPSHFVPVTDVTELRRIRMTYGIGRDYILALGSIQPRKNLVRLIKAYESLHRVISSEQLPQLVLAGRRGWLEAETIRAAELSEARGDILFIGYVPDADIPVVYSGALCFAYLSYFEGFGLPILEAMQCGTPVIAGNRTSLPEVAGDAALLVDPFDQAAIGNGLVRLIKNANYRAELRVKGLDRAAAFNWKNTARLTLQAYERAARTSEPERSAL
ncbi:MAG TPA: glycosyltransferase family 1 protein [Pyrinomonadaceae bacterium]|jgi:glycosyltransferase involved in cell wall biosynthesis|nr:glycosyltransferase family 1 protein [Pyrinomonadaceae bacterium]